MYVSQKLILVGLILCAYQKNIFSALCCCRGKEEYKVELRKAIQERRFGELKQLVEKLPSAFEKADFEEIIEAADGNLKVSQNFSGCWNWRSIWNLKLAAPLLFATGLKLYSDFSEADAESFSEWIGTSGNLIWAALPGVWSGWKSYRVIAKKSDQKKMYKNDLAIRQLLLAKYKQKTGLEFENIELEDIA